MRFGLHIATATLVSLLGAPGAAFAFGGVAVPELDPSALGSFIALAVGGLSVLRSHLRSPA